MNALNRSTLAVALGVSLQQIASAQLQLVPAKDAPLLYIHHHLYVSNIDAQMKFWVATLGATPVGKFPNSQIEVVKFRNVFVSLTPQTPTGGTKGSTVNHIGFQVPDIRAMVERLKAAGYPIITKAEVSSGAEVKDDLERKVSNDTQPRHCASDRCVERDSYLWSRRVSGATAPVRRYRYRRLRRCEF